MNGKEGFFVWRTGPSSCSRRRWGLCFVKLDADQRRRAPRRLRRAALCAVALAIAVPVLPAASAAAPSPRSAPLDQPGPPLSVPAASLRSALTCSPDLATTRREPVLLVPGTWVSFDEFFRWNYAAALSRQGIAWCGLSLPQNNTGDIQIAAQYEVPAIRYMHRISGHKIGIIGHSQGGMQPRWALRFWPDVREMVADLVGLAPDNQGGTYFGLDAALVTACARVTSCPTTISQQVAGSAFITALNSRRQMFPGIAYSVVYSRTDGLIAPVDAALHGPGTYSYTALQDVCPGNVATHVTDGSTDPVAWALALDAVTHPGPARASRLEPEVCSQVLIPGLDAATAAGGLAATVAGAAAAMAAMPYVSREPPSPCYVRAACRGGAAPTLSAKASVRKRSRGQVNVTVLVTTAAGDRRVPVGNATVTFQGRAYRTDGSGHARFASRMASGRTYSLRVTRAGCNPASAMLRNA